jgi:hypothetical protein
MEIQTIASLLSYYETIRERTLRVVSLVPPDRREWRHAPDGFASGDLARHIAAVDATQSRKTRSRCRFTKSVAHRGTHAGAAASGTQSDESAQLCRPSFGLQGVELIRNTAGLPSVVRFVIHN